MMKRGARRASRRHREPRDSAQLAFTFADEALTSGDGEGGVAPGARRALGRVAPMTVDDVVEPVLDLDDLAPSSPGAFVIDATRQLARAAQERRLASSEAAAPPEKSMQASDWFDLACELETESPARAREAYHRALTLDPTLADAHINLGRLYHEASDPARAEAHYRAATEIEGGDPIAWFNLGVLLEDLERSADAISAYRAALARDPDHADAHYNLGLLLDHLGQRAEAMSQLMHARRLYASEKRRER